MAGSPPSESRTPAAAADWETFDTARGPLSCWLRLLGAGTVALLAMPEALAASRAFLSNLGLHLPGRWRALRGAQARAAWLACAAHAAAHLMHGGHRFAKGSLKPIQQVLLGVLEDARVERLAWQGLPGLRRLWLGFHVADASHGEEFNVLLLRLARALIDDTYDDPHPWVRKGVRLFFATDPELGAPMASPAALRAVASRLGNDIGQMRLQFNAKTYVVDPLYRDDNAHLWADEPEEAAVAEAAAPSEGARREPGAAAEGEGEGEARRAVPAGKESDEHRAADATLLARHPEWDRLIQRYRADWCTVVEAAAPAAQAQAAGELLERHGAIARELRRLLHHSRLAQPRRLRRQSDGDALDLDAALREAIARRIGQAPDGRVFQRVERRRRELDVLLLVDLSASTLDPLPSGAGTVLDLTREAALLGAMTIDLVGDRCAVHGFCSNGRNEVRYTRLKGFEEPFDGPARDRIAGMQGALSTRMGAALRHATREFAARRSDRKLAIVVTDGKPYDIDVHDPEYLLEDARRAVLEARRAGVQVLGLTVDAQGAAWAERIFGRRRFVVLDRVEALPAALPALYLRLVQA